MQKEQRYAFLIVGRSHLTRSVDMGSIKKSLFGCAMGSVVTNIGDQTHDDVAARFGMIIQPGDVIGELACACINAERIFIDGFDEVFIT